MTPVFELQDDIKALYTELKADFIERDEEILGAILAILANENILYLGPPGTAKTYLAQSVCKCIEAADFFYYLLTRFTTPEEVFGPLSIKSLENDEFKRKIDGCLPASHIAFLDEIFKANSSILNSLLTVLNERRYHNGKTVINTPLLTVFGASNELPEEDENLEALYDRFLFRYDVGYIQNEENVKALLFGDYTGFTPSTRLTIDQIKQIRDLAQTVAVPAEVQEIIISIKKHLELRNSDDADIPRISDRRWKKIIGVLKVAAAANGDGSVDRTMLLLLQHMLWDLPDQKEQIRALIVDHVVTGGIDSAKLESGIRNVQALLSNSHDVLEDVGLPVPVYAHDSDGNNTKVLTYLGLVEASRSTSCYYFTIDSSLSTCYQYAQVLGILESKYGFSINKCLDSDKKKICDAEFAYLEKQYRVYEKNIRAAIDLKRQNLDLNIWLASTDKDEILYIQEKKLSRLVGLEEKMAELTRAIRP